MILAPWIKIHCDLCQTVSDTFPGRQRMMVQYLGSRHPQGRPDGVLDPDASLALTFTGVWGVNQ